MSRIRVLRNAQAQPEHTFYVGTTLTDPDGNTATVDITRGDGTVFATNAATTRVSAGLYRYTLAPQADLELFTFLFEGTFGGVAQQSTPTLVEVVGNFYVPIIDIRNLDGLSDTTLYPNAKLAEARQWFEDLAEEHCGVAFVPRYQRDLLDGDGTHTLILSKRKVRRLISVKVDGTAVATSNFKVWPFGKIERTDGTFQESSTTRNVEVIYEHGFDAPDVDLREAALVAIRDHVLGLGTGIPPNATGATTEFASLTFSVPGPDAPTGLPSVDRVLNAKAKRGMAVA